MVPISSALVQSSHLDILNLGLCHAGALPREEFLLLIIDHAVLHLVRFGCRALRLGKLLVHDIGLHLGVVVLSCLILSDGHLVRRNLDTPTRRMDRLLVFIALAGGRMPLAASLDMHDARRRRNGHLLRLQHLLLEVLAVAQLVLLDREAQPVIVVVRHAELVAWPAHVMARLHHDRLASVLVVRGGPVRARMQRI